MTFRSSIALPTDRDGCATFGAPARGYTVAFVVGEAVVKLDPDEAQAFARDVLRQANQCAVMNADLFPAAHQLRMSADEQAEMPV